MPFSLQMSAAAAFVDGALYVMPPVAGDSELAKARRCYDVWPKRGNNGVPVSYTHLTLPTNREV